MDSLLDRFLRYVRVDTTAVDETESYPSSAGQLALGRLLVAELRELGLTDAAQDEHGIVTATVPGTVAGAPVLALLAHLDTSPESSGANVKPIVHANYDGKDIPLPGDPSKVIRVAESEGLAGFKGKTIITSDGTTLLGADDKAGVAVIMTAAERLLRDPSLRRGPIRVAFTCDEEVGRGVDKVDLKRLGADFAYTLDGESAGVIENETFSADLAVVAIRGRNIHPGLAYGRMVNAIRLAGQFLARMPWDTLSPETTKERQGFLHPYVLEGGVGEARIRILLRSFETAELAGQADTLRGIAAQLAKEHPRAEIDVQIKQQYRNMSEPLRADPRVVDLAAEAIRGVGLTPKFEAIRGGTDGSRLSAMGLLTPNIGCGMHNFHSPLEYACLEEMGKTVEVLIELARLWADQKRAPSAR